MQVAGHGQKDIQNKVNTTKQVEENFGKDNGNKIDMQQKVGDGIEERDRVQESSPTKSTQNINQVIDTKPVDDKGEVKVSNLNKGTEEDHHSIARKNDIHKGRGMEIDKGEDEVQLQANATNIDKRKEDHTITSTDQRGNVEDTQTLSKEGVGDDIKGEEDLQPNIKDISKSGDLSPQSIRELNKEKKERQTRYIKEQSNSNKEYISKAIWQ